MRDVPSTLPRVLVVEDDAAIRKLLTNALQREPLSVESAFDGVDALEKIAVGGYAVLLVDLMLPRMNGYDLIDNVAKLGLQPPPIVVVMTAFDDGAIRQLDATIVHAFLRKPFDLGVLVQLVRDCAETLQGKTKTTATIAEPPSSSVPLKNNLEM